MDAVTAACLSRPVLAWRPDRRATIELSTARWTGSAAASVHVGTRAHRAHAPREMRGPLGAGARKLKRRRDELFRPPPARCGSLLQLGVGILERRENPEHIVGQDQHVHAVLVRRIGHPAMDAA